MPLYTPEQKPRLAREFSEFDVGYGEGLAAVASDPTFMPARMANRAIDMEVEETGVAPMWLAAVSPMVEPTLSGSTSSTRHSGSSTWDMEQL